MYRYLHVLIVYMDKMVLYNIIMHTRYRGAGITDWPALLQFGLEMTKG